MLHRQHVTTVTLFLVHFGKLFIALFYFSASPWGGGRVMGKRSEAICLLEDTDSVCGRGESLTVTKYQPSVCLMVNFPACCCEQSQPGGVKAHGKARPARRASRMWLRKKRSVSDLQLQLSPGPSCRTRPTGQWEKPWGSIPWPPLTTPPLFKAV